MRIVGVVMILLTCVLVAGCPPPVPGEHPAITVTQGSDVLVISGHGFATSATLCAHLYMTGPTGVGTVSIGDPSCSGGGFADFPFPYSYGACVNPGSTTSVTVVAQDPASTAGASQTLQIPWGPSCVIAPAACINGGAACVACGGEGQPVCSNGGCVPPPCTFAQQRDGSCTAQLPDLHPNRSGAQLICTANCGHTQGYSPCYSYMDGCSAGSGYPATLVAPQTACSVAPTGVATYSCYDNATIMNNGSCQCAPSVSACPVNSSPANGICQSTGC